MIEVLSSELILHRPWLIYDKCHCLNIRMGKQHNQWSERRYIEFKYRSPFCYLALKWYSLGWLGHLFNLILSAISSPCYAELFFVSLGVRDSGFNCTVWANFNCPVSNFVRKWAKRHVYTSITPHRCQRDFAQYLIDTPNYIFIIFFSCTWDL